MKKRICSLYLVIIICMLGIWGSEMQVKATDSCEDIEFSSIMTDEALVGYANNQTRGVYFSDGYSIINKISSTKVGAGGVTNANVKCKVQVNAILERKNSSGSWVRVTSWLQINENAYSVAISKSVIVASGYYYRVRCQHYAGGDSSSSFTNGLWIGN